GGGGRGGAGGAGGARDGWVPPNIAFSRDAAGGLLVTPYGPGPFQPPMAWESCSVDLMSAMYEPVIVVDALLSAIPRFCPRDPSPCRYTRSTWRSCASCALVR